MSTAPLLAVRGLRIVFPRSGEVLREVELELRAGEFVALVGPSGAGKSSLALALLGLLPRDALVEGELQLGERVYALADAAAMVPTRGREIALLPQDPLASLDPLWSAVEQASEASERADGISRTEARARALACFRRLGLRDPEELGQRAPHALSGGERQRVLFAATLARAPRVLLLDEPTSSLDRVRARELLELVRELLRERGMAALWITHDVAAAHARADRVLALRAGRVTPARQEPDAPTRARAPSLSARPLLSVRDVSVERAASSPRAQPRRVLQRVALELGSGEVLSVVGASGSGKSTLLATLAGLLQPVEGVVEYQLSIGEAPVDPSRCGAGRRAALRRSLGLVLQDPGSSLHPRLRVQDALLEALEVRDRREANLDQVRALLLAVGLRETHLAAWPHELSGGERQRVALARALSGSPQLLLCDEVTSNLDAATANDVLARLAEAVERRGMALCMVTHDLGVPVALGGRLAVLHEGVLVESGSVADVLGAPEHPATRALVAAWRELGGRLHD
jgi:peptide/nickel transport system ATP-binding protein